MNVSERRRTEDWFIAGTFAAGSIAFTLAYRMRPPEEPLGLAAVVALAVLSEALSVRLYFDGWVSVSFVGTAMATVLFGPAGAVTVAAAIAIAGWATAERSPRKLAFNFGHETLAAVLAAGVVAALGWRLDAPESIASAAPLFTGAAAALVLYAVDGAFVTAIVSLTTGRKMTDWFRDNLAWLFPHYLMLGVVAGGLAVIYEQLGLAALVVTVLPLIVARYSITQFVERTRENVVRLEKSNQQLQRAYIEIRDMSEQLRDAYTGTLESLVTALDVRDQETRGHSVRVAQHAMDIARLLGIRDEEELLTVYRGALMHDVGKIGVPDAILLKPDRLTEEEWEFMRRHPAMGYRILAQVPYLRPAAKIVLAHHERWDGAGYPRGLKGEEIPLGARIFAVCDTYDAIISDRPYRRGQSPDAALAEILRCAGTQFDPKVVEAFEAVFPRWREETPGAIRPPLYLPAWRQGNDATGRAAS
ncbi:HD-GYP domain-containing protein [Tepidiforma sp.]|uniref:HD-GYP domain-containing protein n=1 Tax=Tepidiforma sp. TaxID=2682230 RepID=UPI002ADE3626|nr:HD-GYP domain-containing protein [Tepidiforma sp.]